MSDDPKLEELKRALWAADDALVLARTGDYGEQMRMPAVILAVRDSERAVLAHIREQRPKGER